MYKSTQRYVLEISVNFIFITKRQDKLHASCLNYSINVC